MLDIASATPLGFSKTLLARLAYSSASLVLGCLLRQTFEAQKVLMVRWVAVIMLFGANFLYMSAGSLIQ